MVICGGARPRIKILLMSSVQFINPKAEVLKKVQALAMNINAAMGLQDIMKTNLGPKGTLKMFEKV